MPIVNKQVKFLTTQYIGTHKSAYTKGYALIWVLTIFIVAGGYGGDMPEEQADELLDDIDFYYNKVKCRKIEQLLPMLDKMVEEQQQSLRR